MGPYCNFCQTRCFCHFPQGTPEAALRAYRPGVTIIATCSAGKNFERDQTGWDIDLIREAINQQQREWAEDDEELRRR